MGDPRKKRKKFETPRHPWQRERIEKENIILKDFGLKNKKEIWKMESKIRRFREQAKKLIAATSAQAKKEEKQLINKLVRADLVNESAGIDNILDLKIDNILERRLQTQVFRNNLARSVKQARQFIVHGHIAVGGDKVNIPSYLVSKKDKISFLNTSNLNDKDHPERLAPEKTSKVEKTKEAKGEAEENVMAEQKVEKLKTEK